MSPCMDAQLSQGRCKSCYAFAVTGALEAMKALASKENKLTSLSEQNIIDCSGEVATLYIHYSSDLC